MFWAIDSDVAELFRQPILMLQHAFRKQVHPVQQRKHIHQIFKEEEYQRNLI
ncbi:hypothetical protein GCM10023116_07610 [Kistimonas scapharcae]|uniref:Uncharacterized protein n=1 Tax=Kistimonas scapharcae TaxID=1036133 RepID=A0ABP8UXZ5_9GAMM